MTKLSILSYSTSSYLYLEVDQDRSGSGSLDAYSFVFQAISRSERWHTDAKDNR